MSKSRTFKIEMIITVSTDKAIEQLLEMKNEILSGEIQREMMKDGADKVVATLTEIKNEEQK